jgi:hypothetical protein
MTSVKKLGPMVRAHHHRSLAKKRSPNFLLFCHFNSCYVPFRLRFVPVLALCQLAHCFSSQCLPAFLLPDIIGQ